MDGTDIREWAGVPGKTLGDPIRMQISPCPSGIEAQLTICAIPLVQEVKRKGCDGLPIRSFLVPCHGA
jgi:hypothetical protein